MATVLITGANRGIGLALARAYVERGDTVIGACRLTSEALDALGVTVYEGVEVSDDAAVDGLATALGDTRIDILVNNAAIHSNETLEDLSFERIRKQFEVNTLGPLRVTRSLLPRLHEGSKVVIVTSRSGSIGDNGSGNTYGYRISKAAVNMAGVNLALDLKPRGIPVLLLHPGMVKTDMGGKGNPAAVEAKDAAARMVARIDELSLANTGQFQHAEGH
ncbi:MAG: SDR family oxidoreductase [Rhizobiales bacterium]|nr:SDR family oxidoreductase [Hyphomicrobiales bacterium]